MEVKMPFTYPIAVFIIVGVLIIGVNSASPSHNNSDGNEISDHEPAQELKVAKFDFSYVAAPLTIVVWILIASFAKLVFHLSHKLSSIVPESCLVILLGIVIGGIMKGTGIEVPTFSSQVFFLFMLPPIVLEAGYFLQDRAFFSNIGTILLYAVVGTIFNTFTVGLSLFGASLRMGSNFTLTHTLTFAALIAAVDPVAVLAVFEEIHVNVVLYILVFGESLLNDAVTVVLYHLFEALAGFDEIAYKEILLGFASFFVVSIGGTMLGLLWGLATAFTTKYTDHVRVIEPIFVFVMSYLAYLTAEMFHLSGILSIVTCAIVMKPYVELNISRKSHTTIKYFLKMLSSSSETLIFMFLGVKVVDWDHDWNTPFVFVTLIFILVYRALGVVILTFLANKFGRMNKLSAVDQFIMSYGGIRGAVSFSLAILLDEHHFPMKGMFVTTTIFIVFFTVFVQGMTIKPLVRILHVKLRGKEQLSMCQELNQKFLDHLVAGIEEISGQHGHGYYRERLEYFHTHFLRRWLIRDSYRFVEDEEILLAYRRLAYKDALTRLEREGSTSVMFPSGLPVELLAKSAFEASAITASESSDDEDEDRPMLRAGEDVRVPDAIQKDWKAGGVPSGGELEIHDTSMHTFNNLIERNRRSLRHRKMYRNNLIDDDEDFVERGYLFPMKPRATAYQNQMLVNSKPIHYHHKHKPRHHRHKRHKHHKRREEPPKKQLSAIFEEEDGDGRTSPTIEAAPVGPIPISTEDEEPGITFEAKPRGRVGRYPSFESKDAAVNEFPSEDKTDKAEKEKGESKPTEDSPTESRGIPLDSFVVEIDSDKQEEKNAESEM